MNRKTLLLTVAGFGLGVCAAVAGNFLIRQHQGPDSYQTMHQRHHGSDHAASHKAESNMAHSGGGAHQHDEANMPGLRGKDTLEIEERDLRKIFQQHQGITRSVETLPNGIRTTTEAKDEELRDAIISHVSMMVTRLEEGRNPEVIIQSPTLDALFDYHREIETEIEVTELGISVLQTSSNPKVVALLQKHAGEVSDMAARGMAAVHERMMGPSS